MEKIEKLKLIIGLILISFSVIIGIVFFLESFGILNNFFSQSSLSMIYEDGVIDHRRDSVIGGGASNVTIFIGLCSISGS